MSLKKWLQKNEVFDKDLLRLLPKYGVNDPDKDLGKLKPDQWKQLKTTIKTDRAKELKDNAAKLRLQKKLTKVEKLWKAKRPKKKTKEPKLLKMEFDDDTSTSTKTNGSSPTKGSKKKKSGSKSPTKSTKKSKNTKTTKTTKSADNNNKKSSKSPETKPNGNTEQKSNDTWDHYEDLKLSDTEQEADAPSTDSYKIPTLTTQGSVVDALMAGPYHPGDDKTEESKQEVESADITTTDMNAESEWDRYDDLKLSDDEDGDEEQADTEQNGGGLYVPLVPLKTQGSVVDMLLTGPQKKDKPVVKGLVVTSLDADEAKNGVDIGGPEEIEKDYSITVSYGDKVEVKVDAKDKDKKQKKAMVSLNCDAFVYDEENDVYTVSLSDAKLLKCDYISGKLTFEIKGGIVNKDKSDKAEKKMDDQYIESVLEEINKNNPDSEAEE